MESPESVSVISATTSDCSDEQHTHSEYIPSESDSSSANKSESTVSEIIPVITNRGVGFYYFYYFLKIGVCISSTSIFVKHFKFSSFF